MIPVDIDIEHSLCLLPPETTKVIYAKDQPQYLPLPALRTLDGKVCSRWKLDANELELVKSGVDVFLTCWTFNGPFLPVVLTVGGQDLR